MHNSISKNIFLGYFCVSSVLFIMLSCFKCTSDSKSKQRESGIIGQELIFPVNAEWSIMGRDTTILLYDSPKLVVYYSDSECLYCALYGLNNWKPITKKIARLKAESLNIDVLFILNASKENEAITNTLIDRNFNYPIMFDGKDELKTKNPLINGKSITTILLDENNKVISVGDSIISHNEWMTLKMMIERLYD